MKIELTRLNYPRIQTIINIPDDLQDDAADDFVEIVASKQLEELNVERKSFHLQGVHIHMSKIFDLENHEFQVKSDKPYLQFQVELSNGGISYFPMEEQAQAIKVEKKEFALFYIPKLSGTYKRQACQNSFTLEIQMSVPWIKRHLQIDIKQIDIKSAKKFLQAMEEQKLAIFGGRAFPVTGELQRIFWELYTCNYQLSIKKVYLECKIKEMLSILFHSAEQKIKEGKQINLSLQETNRLHAIKEFLSKPQLEYYSIQTLAERAYMNRTKLQAGFKQLFGQTIKDYAIDAKLSKAYELLSNKAKTSININEIARMVGYRSPHYFAVAFKQKSPSEVKV